MQSVNERLILKTSFNGVWCYYWMPLLQQISSGNDFALLPPTVDHGKSGGKVEEFRNQSKSATKL